MSLSIYVLTDLIHIVKIILLCNMFFIFKKRENQNKMLIYIAAGVVISVISVGIYFYDNDIAETFVYIIALGVLMSTLYEEKIIRIIVSVIWIIFIMSMLDIMTIILAEVVYELLCIENTSTLEVVAGTISIVIVYIIGKIYSKKYSFGVKTIGVVNLVLFTILAIADTGVIMAMAGALIHENQGANKTLYSIVFIFVILGIFLQLGAVILLFMQRNVYKEKKQITEKYLNEQKSHYEYLEKREIETKKFRHDLRNHMQMLLNMAKDHQYEEFDKYLNKIDIKIESFGNMITVQNGIVDAIINQYYSKAKQNDVNMEVKGRFPKDCVIDAYDLCTIFSNVLSNALEAATRTEEKLITVDCRYNDENIIIVVKNSFINVGQFVNGQITTCKDDVDYHGHGLENIKDSVRKYNGILDIDIKENQFIIKLVFNYVEKREYENSNYR